MVGLWVLDRGVCEQDHSCGRGDNAHVPYRQDREDFHAQLHGVHGDPGESGRHPRPDVRYSKPEQSGGGVALRAQREVVPLGQDRRPKHVRLHRPNDLFKQAGSDGGGAAVCLLQAHDEYPGSPVHPRLRIRLRVRQGVQDRLRLWGRSDIEARISRGNGKWVRK